LLTLVFTDLDGSLLDHDSYSWSSAAPALAALRRLRIPLIFCTSKTAAEVTALRREIGNRHPFIAENGGSIVIPPRYFRQSAPLGSNGKALTLLLGRPYEGLLRELKKIADETRVEIRGFHQMADAEVARATGLTREEAKRARQRQSSEPFVFRSGGPSALRRFRQRALELGYSLQRGGRFWHFSEAHDKGLAMSVLIGFYGIAWRSPIHTVALGDSGNDLSMLRLADRPILIPKPDGIHAREVLEQLPNVTRAQRPGPAGWNAALLMELQNHAASRSCPNGHPPGRRSQRSAP
jgi:mannosyl-3-phosphoglycerate phosphatase